jgi:hypothetical protein
MYSEYMEDTDSNLLKLPHNHLTRSRRHPSESNCSLYIHSLPPSVFERNAYTAHTVRAYRYPDALLRVLATASVSYSRQIYARPRQGT